VLGKLGAFNDSRLQVAEHAIATVHAISHMPYRVATKAEEPCYFHAMGDCEFKGNWMRCWCDAVPKPVGATSCGGGLNAGRRASQVRHGHGG
jgi:hypothetical protein